MSEKPELTALTWPDGRPKIAPVRGYAQGIPWSLHLKAYNAYCKKYSPQEALIDLAARGCRGGFAVEELNMFVPGWRDEVEELSLLRTQVANLTAERAALRQAIMFFSSAVKGREPWTATCEDVFWKVIGELPKTQSHPHSTGGSHG